MRTGLLEALAALIVIAVVFIRNESAGSGSGRAHQSEDRSRSQGAAVAEATFAGGCFWCMEAPFEKLDGVIEVVSGYSGGQEKNPTYDEVSAGATGHAEAIQVRYDPTRITYQELLDVFWRQIDPTDAGGQFADRGHQYRTAIFYHDDQQRRLAEESKAALERSGRYDRPLATQIVPFTGFYPAEDYHQDYYKKNPLRYKLFTYRSGREPYLARVWGSEELDESSQPTVPQPGAGHGKRSDAQLKQALTPLQYEVTQRGGTEHPFQNAFWDNKAEGIYVDVVSGEPLFSSRDKFESGTGWPSFTKPLEPGNIVETGDNSLFFFMGRTEVRSKKADSHLGHVFNDGPAPTGLRYCINSAALRFIPKDDLEREGYDQYLALFAE